MKILHTSDWHLGMRDGEKSLRDDQVFFIEEICRIIRERDVDVLIIAGDMFDRSMPSSEAVGLYDETMTRICLDMGKEVILIAGNHDSAERLGSCNRLLKKAGLHVLGALEREPQIVSYEEADIYMFPWFKESKVRSLYPEEQENIRTLQDAYRIVCDRAKATFDPVKKHIAVAHAFMTKAETSTSDRAAVIGFADQVGKDVFQGFDYVALGHIHKPQNVGENAAYSGTPMPYSFGAEEKQEKSVILIDTDTMNRETIPLKQLHRRVTVEGTLEEILTGDYPEDVLKGYTKIIVTDSYVGLNAMSGIADRFENCLEVSGKDFSDENSSIRMTMDEFRQLESDPMEIFRNFCRDTLSMEPDERIVESFADCVAACTESESEVEI